MAVKLRWIRLVFNCFTFLFFLVALFNYQTIIYLLYQAKGQYFVLANTTSFNQFIKNNPLTQKQKEKLLLVEKIKAFSIDSLGYKPTRNFTRICNQDKIPPLWVITACAPYDFEAYEWHFPILGDLSYKGFFNKELALKEYNHLICLGYDVDIRTVTAWSTLGWLNDPLTSHMLNSSKGGFCNLLFHELFHATYYMPGKVDFNENLASFIAHKATLKFLENDSAALKEYIVNQNDNAIFSRYMLRQKDYLKRYYRLIKQEPSKLILKLKALYEIADSISYLPIKRISQFTSRKTDILKFKNAYFVDLQQYESLQDSLEKVFNKVYSGRIKKMVQDLRQNGIYY